MATASELIVASQIEAVRQNAELHGWKFEQLDPVSFILGMPAKGGSFFHDPGEVRRLRRQAASMALVQSGDQGHRRAARHTARR